MTRVSTLARANPFVFHVERGNDLGTVARAVIATIAGHVRQGNDEIP